MKAFGFSVFPYVILTLLLFNSPSGYAQEGQLSPLEDQYQQLLNGDFGNQFALSPDESHLLIAKKAGFISFHRMQDEQYLDVAGVSLNKVSAMERNNRRYSELSLLNISTQERWPIKLQGTEILDFSWSPQSDKLAIIVRDEDGKLILWNYVLGENKAQQWNDLPLAVHFARKNIAWLPDNNSVVVKKSLMHLQKGNATYAPSIQDSQSKSASRVYRNTFADADLLSEFKEIAKHQLVVVHQDGERTLTPEGVYGEFSVSPDGRYVLAEAIKIDSRVRGKLSHFPRQHQVFSTIDSGSNVFSVATGSALPVGKTRDGAPEGARKVQWQPDKSATLSWIEAMQVGAVSNDAQVVDQITTLASPFTHTEQVVASSNWRIHEYFWSSQQRLVFVDWCHCEKRLRVWSEHATQPLSQVLEYDYTDKYGNPGDIDYYYNAQGIRTLTSGSQGEFYFLGEGLSAAGKRPFVDSVDRLGGFERLFQSTSAQNYRPIYVLQDSTLLAIVESLTRPPTLVKLQGSQPEQSLTALIDRDTPHFDNERMHIEFQRADGLTMRTDIYFPQSNQEVLPAVVWVYPRETTMEKGQQRLSSDNSYLTFNPMGLLTPLLEGVAVVDMSNFPLVKRDGQSVNDSFIEQHVENSTALLAALQKTGRIDTSRLLVMGHSYGAFSAANLLVHTDDYVSGILRSGAYNRTITPLGFQRERRSLWEAQDLYIRISPLFFAHKINEPVLLIHGENDQNPGTSVLQSRMFFEALQANGKQSRLVILPEEGHDYAIKENVETALRQQGRWMKSQLTKHKSATAALVTSLHE